MATVMVVDDSRTVRKYHRSLLNELGVDVVEAENGMEALERSLGRSVGLYLIDVNMPVMDGYSLVAELRKQPKYRLTPVIMITTQQEEADRLEAYRIGANLFETKPIQPDRLRAYITLLLKSEKGPS
jgi:two-component system chemotaxis response regulator CheY